MAAREPRLDPDRSAKAEALAAEIYRLHEAGRDYRAQLALLSELTEERITGADADAAFGSVSSHDWARELLMARYPCPTDLSDTDLVDLIRAISECQGEDWQTSWWLRCVVAHTGCVDVSDLIFHPQGILGPDDDREVLTPEEISSEAKRRPRRTLVTPPPR